MSDYINRIFTRTDLPVLRSLLVDGLGDGEDADHRSYQQRIAEGCAPMHQYFERACPDLEQRDEVFCDFSQALTACQDVYFEIGLKCGARLLQQLLSGNQG